MQWVRPHQNKRQAPQKVGNTAWISTAPLPPLPSVERPQPLIHAPITLPDVRWKVLSGASCQGDELICVSPQGYQSLSAGMADLLRYVKEPQAVIGYYKQK